MPEQPLIDDKGFGAELRSLLIYWGVRLWPNTSGEVILVRHHKEGDGDPLDHFIDQRHG